MSTDDENLRMIQLARQIGALLETEPDRETRFAVLAIHVAQHVAQVRAEDRAACLNDIFDLIVKYEAKFVTDGTAQNRWSDR